jgi:hypothetical protein
MTTDMPNPAFCEHTFRTLARQLAGRAADYATLGVDAADAARWANRGFLPGEARPWLDAGFTADDAARWADRFIGPAEALTRLAAQPTR